MVCADLKNVSGGPWFESRSNQDFIFTISPGLFSREYGNLVVFSLVVFDDPHCASRNAVRFLIIRFLGLTEQKLT